jgi:hypothetical protein
MANVIQYWPYGLAGIGALIVLLSVLAIIKGQLKIETRAYRYWTKFRPAPADRYRLKRPDSEPTDY